MKAILFKVICNYELNQYQIITENNAFKHLNCICSNPTELVRKIMSITSEVRKHRFKALFVYE